MRGGVVEWIKSHDDRWMFTIVYLGLAIVLSVFISIFWLALLVFIHGVLEWLSLKAHGVNENRILKVFWHLKLDITLVVFALWLGIYLEAIFGVLGLAQGAKAGVHAASKFAAWQTSIKGVLLSLDDLAQIGKAVMARKK